MDKLSVNGITEYLDNKDLFKIEIFDEVSSTNLLIKEAAAKGEAEGKVILANSQTAGRGRLGRTFQSPFGSGIYMSILLRPKTGFENALLITCAAAVAASETIESLSGKETQIKWVNDIMINGKKVCGILTEGGINPKNGEFDWAVLGIGVNLYPPKDGFNPEIKDIATAIFEKEKAELKNRLAAAILNRFWEFYSQLDTRSFFEGYKSRLLTLDKQVTVICGEKKSNAFCCDIDSDCRLLVEYEDGKKEYISSGEISVRPKS